MFAYCANEPINRHDPSGFIWDFLDIGMAALSWADFEKKPSMGGLALAVVDTVAILPIIPSTGYVRRGAQVANKVYDGVKSTAKVVKKQPIAGKITGYTSHGLNQAIGRDGGIGVANKAILDTVKNPKKVVPQETQYGIVYKYVGKNAVVVLNELGEVVTTYAKGSAGIRGRK